MLQFTASLLGSKAQLVPPTENGKYNGCVNSEIGYCDLEVSTVTYHRLMW